MRGIQTLAGIANAGKSVHVRTAALLLDYGWGKPRRSPRRAPAQEVKGDVRVVIVRHVIDHNGRVIDQTRNAAL